MPLATTPSRPDVPPTGLVAPALRLGYSSGTRPDGSGLMPVRTAQAHPGTCLPMLDFPACNHLLDSAERLTLLFARPKAPEKQVKHSTREGRGGDCTMREINEARKKSSAQSSQVLFQLPGTKAGCRPAPARVKTREVVK